jgi:HEAT repeat protein
MAVIAAVALTAWPVHGQVSTPQPSLTPGSVTAHDASLLAAGWTLFSQGDHAGAARMADDVLGRAPRSVAAIALAIEAAIAGAGGGAGLARYERWLGPGQQDEPALLRTIARAMLVEIAGQPQNPRARTAALQALAEIGETLVIEAVRQNAYAGGLEDTAILASTGDAAAVQILIAELGAGRANKLDVIDALVASRHEAAVAPLAALASSTAPPVVRDAAVDALGNLGHESAIPHLKLALGGPDEHRRAKAAAALLKLDDDTGVAVLRRLAQSPHPTQRLAAARGLAARPDGSWLALVRPLLAETDPEIRIEAATLLLPHDPEAARAVLQPLVGDENPTVRDMAQLAMVEDPPATLDQLRVWLRSPDRMIRVRAAARILTQAR